MGSSAKKKPSKSAVSRWMLLASAVTLLGLIFYFARQFNTHSEPTPGLQPTKIESDSTVFAAYAGSQSCRECHQEAFFSWKTSHHALAERPPELAVDHTAFEPSRRVKHGAQTSESRLTNGRLEIVTAGLGGRKAFAA